MVVQEFADGTNISFGRSRNGLTKMVDPHFRFDSTELDYMSLTCSTKHPQLIAWRTKTEDMKVRTQEIHGRCHRAVLHMMMPELNPENFEAKDIRAGQLRCP